MPRQNRVTPRGDLIATPARGAWMGNRGCLHDAVGRIRHHHRGVRWIYCRLHFKGRRRPLMAPGRYTELFFWDEATALAAGHRPCAECQRARFQEFRTAWLAAHPALDGVVPSAAVIDVALHRARLTPTGQQQTFRASCTELPDGVCLALEGDEAPERERTIYLLLHGGLYRWTPGGYAPPRSLPLHGTVRNTARVLTPRPIVRMLAHGFRPDIRLAAG